MKRIFGAVALVLLQPWPAVAQTSRVVRVQPLQVERISPATRGTPSSIITISFDRPLVESLHGAKSPATFIRMSPAVEAAYEWRDPATVRILPRVPLTSGASYRIAVDTSLVAMDGSRLDSTVERTITVALPESELVSPRLDGRRRTRIPVDGIIRIMIDAPVDTVDQRPVARLDIDQSSACSQASIAYRLSMRLPTDRDNADPLVFRRLGHIDTLSRILEFTPLRPIPDDCSGVLHLPVYTESGLEPAKYQVSTTPKFDYVNEECLLLNGCVQREMLTLTFNAPVSRKQFMENVRLHPAPLFLMDSARREGASWKVPARLGYRTRIRIDIDTAFRDVNGRRFMGAMSAYGEVADATPTISHATGSVITSATRAPTITVRHVNADSVELRAYPIGQADAPRHVSQTIAWDTTRYRQKGVRVVHSVSAAFNAPGASELRLPREITGLPGTVWTVSAYVHTPQAAPDTARRADDYGNGVAVKAVFEPAPRVSGIPTLTMQFSNLAVHARLGGSTRAAWVTDVRNGMSVQNAKVRLLTRDFVAFDQGVTSRDGITLMDSASSPASPGVTRAARPGFIEVTSGSDRLVLPLMAGFGSILAPGVLSTPAVYENTIGASRIRGSVWTDRPTYRPGDKLYMGMLARTTTGFVTNNFVTRDSARFRIDTWEAELQFGSSGSKNGESTPVLLSPQGVASDSLTIPRDASTGDYWLHAEIKQDGEWKRVATTFVEVAEYRVPEFLVVPDTDTKPALQRDELELSYRASYMHGAPVAGADVRMKVKVYHGVNPRLIKGLPNSFTVGRLHGRRYIELPSYDLRDTTDMEGKVRLRFRVYDDSSSDVRSLGIVTTVTDVSRAQITTSEFRPLHPASFYLGMAAAERAVTGDTLAVSVIGLSLNGEPAAGRRFSVAMLRLRSERSEEFVPEDEKRFNYDTIYSATHITTDSILKIRIPMKSAGFMIVEVGSTDENGRKVSSNVGVNVTERPSLTPSLSRALALHVSDTLAAIGDTVTISFDSPFDRADAWITSERDGVLSSERRKVRRGRTLIRVPVTERTAPMLFYGVTLVPQGVEWSNTSQVSERTRHGYATVHVDMRHKKIDVSVNTDRDAYIAGDTVRVRLRARGNLGQPVAGAAIVWAVDEAVLALGDYEALWPFEQLHSPFFPVTSSYTSAIFTLARSHTMRDSRRRTEIEVRAATQPAWTTPSTVSLSAITTLGEHMLSLPVTAIPGTIPFDESQLRSDFRSTAFFVAHVPVDSTGNAEFARILPGNVTRYRVFAFVADSTSRVGTSETEFGVSKPLLIRAALPRFVRAGDSVVAGGAVSTTDDVARQSTVTMTIDSVPVDGERKRTVLAATKPEEVRFAFTVPDRDTIAIALRAQARDASDGVLLSLPVLPVMRPRVLATAGTVRGTEQVRIALPATADIDKSQLTLRIGNTPLPLLQFAGSEAMRYSFECSEQLASNIRVLSALLALQRDGRDAKIDTVATFAEIDRLAKLLQARVTDNGDVQYWPGDVWHSPWLTGYTGLALLDARDVGIAVDKLVLDRMLDRLRLPVGGLDTVYGSRAERGTATQRVGHAKLIFAIISRRSGTPALQHEQELLEQRARLTWEDRAALAELLHDAGMKAEARTLLAALWNDVPAAGAMVDIPTSSSVAVFPSTVRAPALLLTATIAAWPDHPMLGALAERLMSRTRAAGSYWNTQDHGWIVPALASWTRTLPAAPTTITVSAGGTSAFTLTAGALSTKDTTISIAEYSRRTGDSIIVSLTLQNEHAGAVFAATVSEVSTVRAVTPDSRGLTVERWVERYSDGASITDIGEGELVRVRLRVRANYQREFVALEDWLPSGLEVVDPSLRTSASLAALTDYDAEEAERERQRHTDDESGAAQAERYWFGPWEYRELRDDKVRWFARQLTPGTHTVSYIARATTAGKFIRPPAHAEEMYNPGVNGRSEGGWFGVRSK